MSKQIDERVVEMRFDNKHFEKNVQNSLSTIEKLKEKLNFKGVDKSFNNLDKAAKKVDMKQLGDSVETVRAKFSALEVMGVTALANITNSAVNAGKKIVSALTIDPLKTGFQEYETQINAVQTILANTQSKGTTLDQVNAALDTLNTYADKTIYNFTEMTRNIGMFTAAGVDLETSVNAIQGIANLAAVSGSTSQQASTAMYQLSQALAAGTVKLMDWNSVVNAGMGGQVFQDSLKETARIHGIAIDQMIEDEGSFRETLKDGWLTSEILTETLQKFTLTTEGLTDAQIEQNREMLRAKGYTEDQIEEIFKLGETATDAATKVKTFSQMWDVIKESVQSGWAQTWRLLFGDFEEAKSLFTPLTNFFTNIIQKFSDFRNKLLEGALSSPLGQLAEKIKNVSAPVTEVTEKIENLGEVVNDVIKGSFGNGQNRIDKLTKSGYDWAHIQNLVNEKLGDSTRHATDYKEVQEELTEQIKELTDEELRNLDFTDDEIKAYRELEAESKKTGKSISELLENMNQLDGRTMLIESLKNAGSGIVGVFKAMKDAWISIFPPATSEQLYNIIQSIYKFSDCLRLTNKDTGELNETGQKLMKTFKGIFAAIDIVLTIISGPIKLALTIFSKLLGAAGLTILDVTAFIGDIIVKIRDWIDSLFNFTGIFKPVIDLIKNSTKIIREWFDAFKKSEPFQKLVDKIKDFGEAIKMDGSAAENFKKITEGLTTMSTKLAYVLNASLLSGLKVLGAVLNLFGTNLMDVAASVIDYLAKAKKWVNENVLIANSIDEVAKILKVIIDGVKSCVDAFMSLEVVQKAIEGFKTSITDLFDKISGGFSGLGVTNFCQTLEQAFARLKAWINGLKSSENIGRDIIAGLINGLKAGASSVISTIISIGTSLISAICGVLGINSPSKVFFAIGGFLIAGLIAGLATARPELLATLKDIGLGIIEFAKNSVFKVLDFIKNLDFGKVMSIAITAGLIVAVKKVFDIIGTFSKAAEGFGKMCKSAGNLMDAFAEKVNPKKNKFKEAANAILQMAIAIGILAGSVYVLAQLDAGKLWGAIGALAALAAIIGVLAFAASKIDVAEGGGFTKLSIALIAISAALYIMGSAIKKLDFLTEDNIGPILGGLAAMVGGLSLIMIAFGKFVKGDAAKNIDKAGKTVMKISLAISLMAFAIKMVSKLDPNTLTKGMLTVSLFGAFVVGLVAATRLGGKHVEKLGATILKISFAMLMLVALIKLVSGLDPTELTKGIICITLFGGIITGLIAATRLAGGNLKGIASTIFGISAAMLAMALTVKLVSGLSPEALAKGLLCITMFGGIAIALVAVTSLIKNQIKGVAPSILAISLAIAIMAGVSVILGMVDLEGLAKGITAMGMLSAMVALMIHATKGAADCKGAITAMAVTIGVMAAAIVALSFIDPKKLALATTALGSVIGLFALLIKSMSYLKTGAKGFQRGIITLGVLTLVIAALAGVLAALTFLPNPEAMIPAAASIGALLLAMSTSIAIISNSKTMSAQQMSRALISLGVMTAVVAALGIILAGMSALDVQSAIPNAVALSTLLLAMTGALAILNIIGATVSNALLGILGLTLMVVPLAAFALALNYLPDVSDKVGSIVVLTGVMTAMTALLAVLSLIGALIGATGGMALLGILGLTLMVVPLAAFALALNYLPDVSGSIGTVTLLTSLMTTLTDLLVKVSILGPLALIGVTALTALSGLMVALGVLATEIGVLVTMFPALETFASKGIGILTTLANGLGQIIGSFIGGIAEGITSSLPQIAADLSAFMIALTPFIVGAQMIDASTMEGVKSLAGIILTLTAANIIEGLTSWFTGGTSIVDFGKQIAEFGPYIKQFADSVTGINPEAVEAAANAGKMLAEMASALPNSGGVAGWFAGENDMEDFGSQLKGFGEAIADFSAAVDGKVNASAVESAANAGKVIAELASGLPNSGGVASWFAGENDISDFGPQLKDFGTAIADFSGAVDGKVNASAVESAANAGRILAELAHELPNTGGVASWFAGNNDMSKFGSQLKGFGTALADFSAAIAGKLGGLDSGIAGINKLTKMFSNMKNISVATINQFKTALSELGKISIDGFVASFASGGPKAAMAITTFINSIKNAAVNSTAPITQAFSNVGKAAIINGFVNAFSSASKSAKTAVTNFINSIKTQAANSQTTVYQAFYRVGSYAVDGFAAGINANMWKSTAKARLMASDAEAAAKAELDQNSPSRVFMDIGSGVVEGFVKGISDNLGDVDKSAITLGSTMLTATQDYLKINSPSIVFKDEVGRYIVQGIAEGIEKDMSAEEAAKKKADNIVSAFKKEIDKHDLDIDTANKEFELWSATDGLNAHPIISDAKQIELYNKQLLSTTSKSQLAHDEWKETCEHMGKDSEEAQTALNKYLDAQIEIADIKSRINAVAENAVARDTEERELVMEVRDAEIERWKKMHEGNLTDEKLDSMMIGHLERQIKSQQELFNKAEIAYLNAKKTYGENSVEALTAYKALIDEDTKLVNLRADISEIHENASKREIEALEREASIRDKRHELWEKTYGETVSDAANDTRQIAHLNEELEAQNENLIRAQREYSEAVRKFGAESRQAREAYEAVLDEQIKIADTKNAIADIQEAAVEREKELLEKQYDLAASNADLKYQIWEKIYGRDATNAEKDTNKLTSLNDQLIAQTGILKMAQEAYQEAVDTYGTDSAEALDAYNKYLQEENNLASLHSSILDVKESIEDREKRLQERQRNAKADYLDYMEKYEKYYLDHGMTLEELERDAMLVSGYDPTKTVNTTISDTAKALKDAKDSNTYSQLLSSFGELGTSYVTSVSEGVTASTPEVITSTTTMVSGCIESMKAAQPSWVESGTVLMDGFIEGLKSKYSVVMSEVSSIIKTCVQVITSTRRDWLNAGVYVVNGFIKGISSRIDEAAQAAAELARAALAAAEEAFDINSPSKAFAKIGEYAAMGLSKGLSDNEYLAANAATNMGERAINNLRNTIKRISEVVNSDIDTQPTIRPVLDLSGVASGTARLNAMVSRAQAISISSDMARRHSEGIQNGADGTTASGNTYQFTQNNYSPKALSRVEIYRQTKNQFSAMKRMVEA